jgi:hypothetical protein
MGGMLINTKSVGKSEKSIDIFEQKQKKGGYFSLVFVFMLLYERSVTRNPGKYIFSYDEFTFHLYFSCGS